MNLFARGAILALLVACVAPASATVIAYTATNVVGSTWRYDYAVTNDSLAAIEEFTIFFDRQLYSSLSVASSPLDWDSIVVQPDLGIPDDGFFDSLTLGEGLVTGGEVAGFAVSFDWLGGGTPGAQSFAVVDPITFATLDAGFTTLLVEPPPTSVPEPETAALLTAGLAALGLARRRAFRGTAAQVLC